MVTETLIRIEILQFEQTTVYECYNSLFETFFLFFSQHVDLQSVKRNFLLKILILKYEVLKTKQVLYGFFQIMLSFFILQFSFCS